jgi:ERF superfamily
VSPVTTPEGAVIPGEVISLEAGQIYQAMANITRDIEAVGKQRQNTEQRYKFRAIEDVMNVVNNAMAKHGVFLAPADLERIPEERHTSGGKVMNTVHLKVRLRFFTTDGSYVDVETWGEGTDLADKATNKAHSQALKYGLTMAFCIPFADMAEPDAEHEEAGPGRRPRQDGVADSQASQSPWFKDYTRRLHKFLAAAPVPTPRAREEAQKLWAELKAQAEKGQATPEQAAGLRSALEEWGKNTPRDGADEPGAGTGNG